MRTAAEIQVGETVEFEAGSPVVVLEIEENWPEAEDRFRHPYNREHYGRSLVFSCNYSGTTEPNTFYIRREKSPISGPRVVR